MLLLLFKVPSSPAFTTKSFIRPCLNYWTTYVSISPWLYYLRFHQPLISLLKVTSATACTIYGSIRPWLYYLWFHQPCFYKMHYCQQKLIQVFLFVLRQSCHHSFMDPIVTQYWSWFYFQSHHEWEGSDTQPHQVPLWWPGWLWSMPLHTGMKNNAKSLYSFCKVMLIVKLIVIVNLQLIFMVFVKPPFWGEVYIKS